MTTSVQKWLVVLGAILVGPWNATAQSNNVDRKLPTQQELSRFGLERYWWGQAEIDASRDKVRHVSIDEDMVYVLSATGILTAFDSESGQKRWATLLGRYDQPSYPVVSNQDLAFVVVGSVLYAIEKKTGRTKWTLTLPGLPSTAPGVDEERVYIGALDGSVYAFSLRKVRQLYEEQRLPQWSAEAMLWRVAAAQEITSPPVSSGRTVSFCSRDGSLYAIGVSDKRLVYQLETNGAIVAPMAVSGRLQFLASEDNTFFAINSRNGGIEWEFSAGLPIRRAPFVVGEDLYVTPDRGGMYCLNASVGTQRRWQPHLHSFVAVIADAVFASDQDGNLIRLLCDDGGLSATMSLRQFSIRVPNDRTDRIFMTTSTGLVIALRKRGETIPVYHKYPERLPILPEVTPEEPTENAGASQNP